MCLDVWETIKHDKSSVYIENLSKMLYEILDSYVWDFFSLGNFGLHKPSREDFIWF